MIISIVLTFFLTDYLKGEILRLDVNFIDLHEQLTSLCTCSRNSVFYKIPWIFTYKMLNKYLEQHPVSAHFV